MSAATAAIPGISGRSAIAPKQRDWPRAGAHPDLESSQPASMNKRPAIFLNGYAKPHSCVPRCRSSTNFKVILLREFCSSTNVRKESAGQSSAAAATRS
jgi:hypothetical protein